METLTMQAVADLARVQRPVVTVWRRRSATTDRPFPQPVAHAPILFNANEVSLWLAETGHGNNDEPVAESTMYSSRIQVLLRDIDRSSALLLLHERRGESFGDADADVLAVECGPLADDTTLDSDSVLRALADRPLRTAVDEVVEAAFSGRQVLADLVRGFADAQGPWVSQALTEPGGRLLATLVGEICRAGNRAVVPDGTGGLMLVSLVMESLSEHERPLVIRGDATVAPQPEEIGAWRNLAASGPVVTSATSESKAWVHVDQTPADAVAFFDRVGQMLVELGPSDALVVVGQARLMIDPHGASLRRTLLAPHDTFVEPLRYAARLPKGLSRFGGRRRLALWVFAQTDSPWTVAAGLSDLTLDGTATAGIAADVVAATSRGVDPHTHAFTSSVVRATDRFVRQDSLTAPVISRRELKPPEVLARVWELDRTRLLGDLQLATSDFRGSTISFTAATRELGLDLAGTKIAADIIGRAAPGSATIIGTDELRAPSLLGSRAIDRLEMERFAPRARLTRAGDVIYVASGGTAALVDGSGGHVVQAPARIFRCRDAEADGRQLFAAVVADDIEAQTGSDRTTWRLRLVPVDRVRPLGQALNAIEARESALREELRAVSELRTLALDGFASGSLIILPTPGEPTNE